MKLTMSPNEELARVALEGLRIYPTTRYCAVAYLLNGDVLQATSKFHLMALLNEFYSKDEIPAMVFTVNNAFTGWNYCGVFVGKGQ